MNKHPVLVIDDSEDDRLFMRRTLLKSETLSMAWEAVDADEGISYMRGEGQFSDRTIYPFPDVLMVDLKMPGKSGYDVLEWVRKRAFPKLVVVVISGSYLPEDITRCYKLGAHAYHKKTVFAPELAEMLAEIETLVAERQKGA